MSFSYGLLHGNSVAFDHHQQSNLSEEYYLRGPIISDVALRSEGNITDDLAAYILQMYF